MCYAKIVSIFYSTVFLQYLQAQTDSNNLTISGYAEVYYGLDVNPTPYNERPGFLYNYTRSNEIAVNLAFLKASYSNQRVRGNFALQSGTYTQYNLAAEPAGMDFIYEARYKVAPKWNITVRAEYYDNPKNIIAGIPMYPYSLNVDYKILNNAIWRIEGRVFNDKYAILATLPISISHLQLA